MPRQREGHGTTVTERPWTHAKLLRQMLVTDAPLVAHLGTRVYPMVAPEGATMPLATYGLASTDRADAQHLKGDSGLTVRTLEVVLHGQDYDAIDELARTLRERLGSWRGFEGAADIRRIDIIDEADDTYDRPEGGEDDPIFTRTVSLRMHLREHATSLPDGSYGG